MDVREGIVTPEAVLLRFDTAGIPSRALAKLLDVLVAAAVVFAGLFVMMLLVDTSDVSVTTISVTILVTSTLGLFAYPAVAEARYGTTIGKAACGLRVVTVEGGPVRGRHGLIRSALQVVDLALVPVGVVGVVAMLSSRLDQRVGDLVAGTLVLRSRTATLDALAVSFPVLPGYEAYVASLDVTGVSAEQYEVLRSFLTRVQELQPAARWHLADRLARPLAASMRQTLPPGLHPELFCACVGAAYQQRHGAPQFGWAP